jgi:hypothetical protein
VGLKLWAITVGIAVDICGSIIIGIVAFIATADGESLAGPLDMQERFGTFGLALMLVVGIAQTGLGAFVAGRMARVHYVRHGLAVGLFGLVFGVLSGMGGNDGMPEWYDPISYVAVLPVSALGGYLAGVPNRD